MSQPTWTIEKTTPTLAVPDLDVGIAFYQRLGFAVDWRWPESASTHAGLVHGHCSLMLCECDPAVQGDISFLVSNVEACHAEILAAKPWELAAETAATSTGGGCPPKRSLKPPELPKQQPYGIRDFSLVDPWGHQLTFGQEL